VIVGIDIGTQSLKAVVVSDQLEILGEHSVGYQPAFPRPGWVEQDPALWEQAMKPAIAEALQKAKVQPDSVKAVGLAGQLDGCIAVDKDGVPLHPCLIWMDRRAEDEIAGLDADLVQRLGGVVLDASHLAAKIKWLKRHVPAARGAKCFHVPVSYLVSRLTGEHVIDHGTASTSMLYGLSAQAYVPKLLDHFGIAEHELPAARPAESIAGLLNSFGRELTGLPKGLPVAVGTGDDFSSALGAGLVEPGRLITVLGTAEVVGALHPTPVIDPLRLVETHAYSGGMYYIENPGWLSGGGLTWFTQTFGLPDFQTLDAEANVTKPGAEGILFLPALSGAMAPEWLASARGVFFGMTPSHGRGHLARALLEGTAFAMRDVLERVQSLGVHVEALRIVGGGARSSLWCQIRADIAGLPAEVPVRADTSPIGAALLAGAASGIFPDLVSAAGSLTHDMQIVEPRHDLKPLYDEGHQRYRDLFCALKPLFLR
jgi:xylulokinase